MQCLLLICRICRSILQITCQTLHLYAWYGSVTYSTYQSYWTYVRTPHFADVQVDPKIHPPFASLCFDKLERLHLPRLDQLLPKGRLQVHQQFGLPRSQWRDWPLGLALSAAVSGDFPRRISLIGHTKCAEPYVASVANRPTTATSALQPARTIVITNLNEPESREAAPRPRHHCVFRTRTHTRASSLPKMSAGITSTNLCACINQPARARALALGPGTDSPAHAGQQNNHYDTWHENFQQPSCNFSKAGST
jgi:hypothetical protein